MIIPCDMRICDFGIGMRIKTTAEGRRINVSKAGENPTCAEIGDCCTHFKLPFAIEIVKAYPRDFRKRGRVRVLLKKDDGSLYNPAISSSGLEYQVPLQLSLPWKQLMLRIAELVPRHPGRTKKQEPASASNAGTSKSGKGGKKKRWLHFHIVAEDFSSSGTQQAWMGILK
ncbi:hypothetical protein TIFTF001_025208 [Ficus carica]|uniref:Uncharacterized protein n=1 Tax=Ficus carica TaxID=3494 RepID=A0AA88AIH1_FICCA|nr:hypothetical protein TIFTF001_025208 [Ficus carica]